MRVVQRIAIRAILLMKTAFSPSVYCSGSYENNSEFEFSVQTKLTICLIIGPTDLAGAPHAQGDLWLWTSALGRLVSEYLPSIRWALGYRGRAVLGLTG
jgi:hypothetical protein